MNPASTHHDRDTAGAPSAIEGVRGEPVEGAAPSRRTQRWELRVLIPFIILTLAIGGIVAYYIGGWAAVAVGLVLWVVYYTLGWSAEIGAAILRRKSHED